MIKDWKLIFPMLSSQVILLDQNEFWNNRLFDVLMISMFKKTIGSTNVCSSVHEIIYI
jgi:hypothetical protein